VRETVIYKRTRGFIYCIIMTSTVNRGGGRHTTRVQSSSIFNDQVL